MPRCPEDIHEYWHTWITQGWFDWTSDGYPTAPTLHHAQTWWNFRHLDNILLVHYGDMLADLEGEVRRIADFLGIAISSEGIAEVAKVTS